MLTAENYIYSCIAQWPTLYAANSFDEAKMKVMNHLLNVIGNGIRDNEELAEHLNGYEQGQTPQDKYRALKFIEEDFYSGCSEDWEQFVDSLEEELETNKIKYPQMKWRKYDNIRKYSFNPYPNFQKEYSLIYNCSDYLKLDKSWILVAIEYYQNCLIRFQEDQKDYHSRWPSENPEKTKKDFLSHFGNKTNEQISKDYEFPFDGDLDKFLTGRWQKEKARIIIFIEETIQLLMNILLEIELAKNKGWFRQS